MFCAGPTPTWRQAACRRTTTSAGGTCLRGIAQRPPWRWLSREPLVRRRLTSWTPAPPKSCGWVLWLPHWAVGAARVAAGGGRAGAEAAWAARCSRLTQRLPPALPILASHRRCSRSSLAQPPHPTTPPGELKESLLWRVWAGALSGRVLQAGGGISPILRTNLCSPTAPLLCAVRLIAGFGRS